MLISISIDLSIAVPITNSLTMIITTLAGKMLGEGNINAGIYDVALSSLISTNSKFNGMMYLKMFKLINISNLVLSLTLSIWQAEVVTRSSRS